ncbi:hypothetical protein PIB30_016010 [Stylosanthes scabra]|uniref:Uncharacterized protein n=1 Tax=Stylosanthes scabra TaxID=79078 RepID=A0ABU6X4S3_9FABA|nr:hypothetical protein [Stylosanthes scabra]
MRMEGERRKRKLESEEEEKEENEEEKMERFFALVRSTKEARDLLFKKDKTDNKIDEDEETLAKKGKATWIPMFQPEDFIDYGEQGRRISSDSNNVPTTTTPHHASGEGPSAKEKEVAVMKKQNLQEAVVAAAEAPIPDINEEKEKTSNLLDLNLSL